jgi:hypothetical protein
MNHPVEPGTELTVELINEMHTFLCTRSLRVSRSYLGDNDECVFAGDFDHNLEYDELVPFLL